ncbi:MAG: putative sulfate/molybdate transporter [Dehalococcoidales bacterium]
MQIKSFRFNLQELGGAFGDLGTLLPLMVALILINGLNTTAVLLGVGLFYVASGLYYRVPTPVQPLKAVAAISISLGLSASVIGAAGLIMGAILLILSMTNFIHIVVKLFPQAVIRGIQLSIGLTLLRKGIEIAFQRQTFLISSTQSWLGQFPIGIFLAVVALLIFFLFEFYFRRRGSGFPSSLALLTFGLTTGVILVNNIPVVALVTPALPLVTFPNARDLWLALTVLVIPQLPLTLGNAVVGMRDTAGLYFQDRARRVTPRALTTSMGLANLAASFFGAMPMCHGSGGLTAHYKLGARTGAANLMIGGLFILFALLFGPVALSLFSLIPLSVLGTLLVIVGVYHASLISDLKENKQLVIATVVAVCTIFLGNLAYGFGAGILLHGLLLFIQRGLISPRTLANEWTSRKPLNSDIRISE